MNYLCSYWLSPDAPKWRREELIKYFDLQHYLKRRIGAPLTIISNIDYPGAIDFHLPANFNESYAMFTRYYALAQMSERGLKFPICVHDHDLFHVHPLEHDPDSLLVCALVNGRFSDQLVVYPEIAKQDILRLASILQQPDFEAVCQFGYGTEIRHEGLFSTEQSFLNLEQLPFESIPKRRVFNVKDQVSFDILDQHSLDHGVAQSQPIPAGTHAVHGHLNKGPASDVLLNWLSIEMCNL